MASAEEIDDDPPAKRSKLPLLLGLVLAVAGAGGGYYATTSGLLPGASAGAASSAEVPLAPLGDVAFVELPSMVISLGSQPGLQHLRFSAQLETPKAYKDEVAEIIPRVVDVLNGYLRAVEVSELADRRAMPKLRAQMLRRVQIVTGRERVRDLLIMEMVVN